ncbi:MAG TPA: glutamine synthetase [Myxococcales bacterium]|nr:glutamine synthetase [Myxococcales bacterium]HIL81323.1 glutamine synthetase [Myxococcales bacterium]
MKDTGRLDLDALRRKIEDGSIETVLTVFPDMYGCLMGKRIVGRFFLDEVASGGMHACDYLLASDIEMDPTPGYAFTSWETGYGDLRALPDFTTLREAAWLDRTAIVICDAFEEERDVPIAVAPRSILKRQLEKATARGIVPHFASELEFFLFKETYAGAREKNYHNLELSQSYNEDYHVLSGGFAEPVIGAIRRLVDASGVPVEFSKGEASAGQHEINLHYAQAVEMADRHVVYKLAAKEIAAQQGASLSFMAKWHTDSAGNSLHVHMSFTDAEGASLFSGDGEALAGSEARPTEVFRHAVGGLLEHSRALSMLFAPNVNSYKRYVEDTFAPTRIAWSYDNRTVGFRVVGHGPSLRVECRIPGGDANPYLVYAGMLAAALDGIQREIDPGPLFEGNGYVATELPRVPHTLAEAVEVFESSDFVREAFGAEVVEHLVLFARAELSEYQRAVTDFERARFFERI